MVADAGSKFVILGHSERRQDHQESNQLVREKAMAALSNGLRVVMCCGEEEKVRDSGKAESFVLGQLRESLPEISAGADEIPDRLAVAYEPIWAIGTGRTPTVEDVEAMHDAIRGLLVELYGEVAGPNIRILYGGSVKPENARELLAPANVGGALVGGASLTAESFLGIVLAANELETEQ